MHPVCHVKTNSWLSLLRQGPCLPYRGNGRLESLTHLGIGVHDEWQVFGVPASGPGHEQQGLRSNLLDHGMLDMVIDRRKMRDELATVLRLLLKQPARSHGDLPAPAEDAAEAAPAEETAPAEGKE